jgi:hypothetical protein
MTTDRQKICKCGANIAEFLNNISILEGNLRIVTMEKSTTYIPAFKSSINSIYSNINKIEDDCAIDTIDVKWSHSDIFNKIEKMEIIKDSTNFNEKKSDIFSDLSRIRYGIVEKVKDCSK